MKQKYLLLVGLSATLLFAGIDSFIHPNDWVGFVPTWIEDFGLSRTTALHLHAGFEILAGILLLLNWKTRIVGLIVALDLIAIVVLSGLNRVILLTTFRDIGLIFMALYLAVKE